MASQSQFEEKAYIALLGLAEYFRSTKNIKKSIQCLDAVCCLHFSSLFPIRLLLNEKTLYITCSYLRFPHYRERWRHELTCKLDRFSSLTQTTRILHISTWTRLGHCRVQCSQDSMTSNMTQPILSRSCTHSRISRTMQSTF